MIRKKEGPKTEEQNLPSSDMPFTPAHPAWLYPFRHLHKWKMSWTALLIGSMVPDLEYFIWLSPGAYNSHSLQGIFIFNLPMTFILSFLWHHTLSAALLPRLYFLHSKVRIEKYDDFAFWIKKNLPVFLFSALIGICSHLLWDSFCHANGFMVHKIPFLLAFTEIGGSSIRNCYIVWYLSTLVGMIIMFKWLVDPIKLITKTAWKMFFAGAAFWGKILFVAGLIAIARVAAGLSWNWTRHLVIITMGSFFYAIIIVCFWDQWVNKKNKNQRLSGKKY